MPLPMEVHADGYPIQYERRLSEHRGRSFRIEYELVVKGSVVENLAFGIFYLLLAIAIGNNFE